MVQHLNLQLPNNPPKTYEFEKMKVFSVFTYQNSTQKHRVSKSNSISSKEHREQAAIYSLPKPPIGPNEDITTKTFISFKETTLRRVICEMILGENLWVPFCFSARLFDQISSCFLFDRIIIGRCCLERSST